MSARTGRCPWESIGAAGPVHVFVASPLPGRVWVAELDVHLGGQGDFTMLGQLGALVLVLRFVSDFTFGF